MIIWLAELRPALAATGAEQVLRYSSHSSWTRADGEKWKPRLAVPFRRSTQVFDGAFQNQPQDYGSLEVAISHGDAPSPLTDMVWDARRVRIWCGQKGQDTADMHLVFEGLARDIEGTKKRWKVSLQGPALQQPVLSKMYAGTGGAEGPPELLNELKPLLLGRAINLEPTYVNKALGIFQYNAYTGYAGAQNGTVHKVFDSGAELGTSIGDFPTYAALAAAVVPPGRFATCDALGLGRHGGEITGILTIDATGLSRAGEYRPGDLLYDVLVHVGGVPPAKVKADSLDWLSQQLPHGQDIYVTEQETVEELCRRVMLTLGGYVWFTDDGRFTVGLLRRGGEPSLRLDRLNIGEGFRLLPTAPPIYQRRQGYMRSWRVHSYSEVRTPREITPRGAWAAGVAYQFYDLVEVPGPKGTQLWVYISEAPGSPAKPGEDATVWQLFFENTGASVVDAAVAPANPTQGMLWRNSTTGMLSWYNNGVWVPLADITGENTARDILNQGLGATANSLADLDPVAHSRLADLEAADAVFNSGMNSLNGSVNNLWSVLGVNDSQGFRSRVVELESSTASADQAMAQRISALEAQMNAGGTGVLARLGTLETVVVNNNQAISSRTTALETEITNARNGYGNLHSRIATFEQATSDALAGKASALVVTSLQSEITSARSGYPSLSARIGTVSSTIADALAGKASATDLSTLTSEVSGARQGQPSLVANIQQFREATSDALAGKASAQSVSDLSATVNGFNGRITTVESVSADTQGRVLSSYTLRVDANGKIVGFRAQASSTDYTTFDMYADVFRISGAGQSVAPLSFQTGTGQLLLNGTLSLFSSTTGARTNFGASVIEGFYSGNNIAFRLGVVP